MTWHATLYIALVLALVLGAAFPLGTWLARVFDGTADFLAPVERGIYRLCGIDPNEKMGWRGYALALLALSVVHFLLLYAILRLQYWLPFNPEHIPGMPPGLAFNTAASFTTNTKGSRPPPPVRRWHWPPAAGSGGWWW